MVLSWKNQTWWPHVSSAKWPRWSSQIKTWIGWPGTPKGAPLQGGWEKDCSPDLQPAWFAFRPPLCKDGKDGEGASQVFYARERKEDRMISLPVKERERKDRKIFLLSKKADLTGRQYSLDYITARYGPEKHIRYQPVNKISYMNICKGFRHCDHLGLDPYSKL